MNYELGSSLLLAHLSPPLMRPSQSQGKPLPFVATIDLPNNPYKITTLALNVSAETGRKNSRDKHKSCVFLPRDI